jgi:hypothetical protein
MRLQESTAQDIACQLDGSASDSAATVDLKRISLSVISQDVWSTRSRYEYVSVLTISIPKFSPVLISSRSWRD